MAQQIAGGRDSTGQGQEPEVRKFMFEERNGLLGLLNHMVTDDANSAEEGVRQGPGEALLFQASQRPKCNSSLSLMSFCSSPDYVGPVTFAEASLIHRLGREAQK